MLTKGFHQLQMAPLVPDGSLLRFFFTKQSLSGISAAI